MEATTNNKQRTREEISEWFNAARERKEEWARRMKVQWAEERRQQKEAADKHYYDLEWE